MSKRPQPSRPDDPNRPNTKRTGERSEAAFLYQASQRRFAICKPWGDSERYDFILDNRPQPKVHLFRIQIKCTDSLRADASKPAPPTPSAAATSPTTNATSTS